MTFRSRSFCRAWCCVIVLSVLAKCLSFAGEPHPSLPPPVIPECLGVNIHFTDPQPGEMEMLAAAGFKWVRMDLTWASTEREKGVYDFSTYDRLVAHLDKHKLRAIFILDYGNKLYDPDGASPHTDETRAAFARWAAAAVAHFKGKGYLWELWNEPNIAQFWKPKPNVDDYIALAKATVDALRDARLIAGRDGSPSRPPDAAAAKESSKDKPATDGSASRPYRGECFIGPATSTIDLPFLEACFKAGLLELWDAVSVHPYRQSAPETVEEEYRSVRLLIRKYAPKDKTIPVICSEWGYSSAWKDFDEEKQAKYLPREFLTNIANDVALSIWYDWHDDGPDPKEPEQHFGLVRHEYREGKDPVFEAKPAYQAAKTMATQLGGFRFNKRLIAMEGGDFLLFSRKDEQTLVARALPQPDVYMVEVSESGERVVRFVEGVKNRYRFEASTGDFRVLDFLGKELPPLTVKADDDNIRAGAEFEMFIGERRYIVPEKPNDFLRVAAASSRIPLELVYHWPYRGKRVRKDRWVSEWSFEIKNPLRKPLTLFLGFLSQFTIDPGNAWVEELAPSDTRTRISKDSRDPSISIGKSPFAAYVQEFVSVCENPLDVEVLPPSHDSLPVRILNPSGEAASISVRDWNAGVDAAVPVQLDAGVKEKVVQLPLSHPFDEPRSVQIAIHQSYSDKQGSGSSDVFSKSFGSWFPLPELKASRLTLTSEGDKDVDADVHVAIADYSPPDTKLGAVKLSYKMRSGWRFLRISEPTVQIPQIRADPDGEPKKFTSWLHGDGKGCQARIRFIDATGQTFQPDGPKIDWTGWRYVTFPMRSSEEKPLAHWGGADDGVIHYPIKWDTIFLLDNVSRQPVEGEVYLSAPTLIY